MGNNFVLVSTFTALGMDRGDQTMSMKEALARVSTPSDLDAIKEEVAGLRRRAKHCRDLMLTANETRRAFLRGKAFAYDHSAKLIEAWL